MLSKKFFQLLHWLSQLPFEYEIRLALFLRILDMGGEFQIYTYNIV